MEAKVKEAENRRLFGKAYWQNSCVSMWDDGKPTSKGRQTYMGIWTSQASKAWTDSFLEAFFEPR